MSRHKLNINGYAHHCAFPQRKKPTSTHKVTQSLFSLQNNLISQKHNHQNKNARQVPQPNALIIFRRSAPNTDDQDNAVKSQKRQNGKIRYR